MIFWDLIKKRQAIEACLFSFLLLTANYSIE